MKTDDTGTARGVDCPSCGSLIRAALNPFFGVDLAVHKYGRSCIECGWYEFAADPVPAIVESQEPHKERTLARMLNRLGAAINTMRAA